MILKPWFGDEIKMGLKQRKYLDSEKGCVWLIDHFFCLFHCWSCSAVHFLLSNRRWSILGRLIIETKKRQSIFFSALFNLALIYWANGSSSIFVEVRVCCHNSKLSRARGWEFWVHSQLDFKWSDAETLCNFIIKFLMTWEPSYCNLLTPILFL